MEIIDNLNSLLGDCLKEALKPGARFKIAAACFSIYAFEALKKEEREFHIPTQVRERGFYGSEFEIQLKNKLTQRAIAKECAEWIRRKARFRSNATLAPMQQFALVQAPDKTDVFMPLQGFTAVDLGYQPGNAFSNMVNHFDESPHTHLFMQLFEQIWKDPEKVEDVTESLCEHIASVYRENAPERIYFLILHHLFHTFLEELNEDCLPNDLTGYRQSLIWQKLFAFQRDAATGIINKLEAYNGCILADSVGLGKTFTALAVIKYYELRNRSVLVLCPKKLADNWLNYNRNLVTNPFAKDRFNYDVLCHTDLQRSRGESFGIPLNRVNWGNYDLVVIDESHNFRNNEAFKDRETRYQKLMNAVIKQGVKTKVLMLSATPVNNRFNDLRNQLALAYEGEPEQLNRKLRTEKDLDTLFRRAQAAFNRWSLLPPENRNARSILDLLDFDFFELLDSVTIARSRKHITSFYDMSDIGSFPERLKPLSFHCALTSRNDVLDFNAIFSALSELKLAVYAPVSYILPSRLAKYEALYDTEVGGKGRFRQIDRERSLQALMTTNLLKRLESSVSAFRLTLQSLIHNLRQTLAKIKAFQSQGQDPGFSDTALAFENSDFEDEFFPEPDDASIGKKVQIRLADMDLPSWSHHLENDLQKLEALLGEMEKVSPSEDAKLQHLQAQIEAKLAQPLNPGNRKILIFTAFADTADYLYSQLAPCLWEKHQIHTAKVTGSASPQTTLKSGTHPRQSLDFQEILTLFSPRSKQRASILPEETAEIDLLIGTDCISEGQNLQDCDYLINYDIHWNPVRIIQRFGRIDRIGSPNRWIQLVNYWPDISLDEYINLKERVENRMMIADVSATGDDNLLNTQSHDAAYRKEQLRRLQEEVIELEDLKTGVAITDLGLNDFRMDLLNYVQAHSDLTRLPNGLHAVIPAAPEQGLWPGAIFTLRSRQAGPPLHPHNRLHPYYLVYISDAGEVLVNHTEVKHLLDLIRKACKGLNSPVLEACQRFNQASQDGREMAHYSQLLNQAIVGIREVKAEKDLDSLFSGSTTTALQTSISGLDDFELIAFLVIQDISQ